MVKYLIKDTTREEREQIVAESLGNIDASCDGCSSGIVEMYQDYIEPAAFRVFTAASWSIRLLSCFARYVSLSFALRYAS